MFSKFFIDRPIFATVLAILMVLAGLFTLHTLPVAQYPDITPPTVMVQAVYPGADAATVARTVGVPIEQQVNGVEGMLYMSSNSGSDGSYGLTITFRNGTDIDQAAVDVQNRISEAEASLPTPVTQQGVSVVKRSSDQVLFCELSSDRPELYDALYLTNYAQLNIIDALSRVDGVGNAQAFGSGKYSMRVWLDPELMRARNLTPADVMAVIRSQNMEVSAGQLGGEPTGGDSQFQFTLTSQGRLATAEEFGNIIIRTEGTGLLRLKDVARIDLGSSSYSEVAKVNGRPTALIGVSQLPGANAMKVAKGAIEELDNLSQYFPEGVSYRVVMNSTDYVHQSIDEVLRTFLETTLIVMVVILLFLQNWRAVIIPMLTIPVSLIATFAVMKLMGFSINTLTLFGLVLAIAIVVDDAIVVVEDCSRLVDEGRFTRRQAAEKAMTELTGPVVGEVLVLLSVFIPTAFVSGITGELYKQFALTIAVSTAFSGFNALTLTPALCALFLNPRKPTKNIIYKGFNKGYNWVLKGYEKLIGHMLNHARVALLIFVVLTALAFWGFVKWPTSYLPEEDMGYFLTSVELPTGASLGRTEAVIDSIVADVRREVPQVKDVMSIAGMSFMAGGAGSNLGTLFVMLKPWDERKGPDGNINAVIEHMDEITARQQEAVVFSVNPPAIPGLGATSGLSMQLLDINNLGATEIKKAVQTIQMAAQQDPRLRSVTSLYEGTVPQYSIQINRDRAKLQGINIDDIYSMLGAYTGGTYVNDFVEFGRVYQVTLQGDASSRENLESLLRLSVRNAEGKMVPFSAFASVEPTMGEPTVSRYNMYTTASVNATPAKNVSSSEAIQAMEELVHETLGKNFSYAWTGIAYQETQAGTTVSFVFVLAIIMTILVLAAQYESWTSPIAVVLSMPTAVLGVVLGCIFMKQSISIYTQIGLILLLGMAAKNAILIVEYAIDYRKAGANIHDAARDAGVIRFRPIIMTALAFILGVMPMLFASGASAGSRMAIGSAIVFGMTVNAIIGTLFVPNFWVLMQTIQERYLSKLFPDKTPAAAAASTDKSQTGGESGIGQV